MSRSRQHLFQIGDFILSSGERSYWKIECDALTDADWVSLALIASERLKPFSRVEGVPFGGFKFARALMTYATEEGGLLVAEDVLTTGASMERIRDGREAQGIVVFARGETPDWVTSLFFMSGSGDNE